MANTKLSVTNLDISPNDPCERIYHEGSANVDQFAIHFNFGGFRHKLSPKSLSVNPDLNNVWVCEIDDYGINKLFLGNVPMKTDCEGKNAFSSMFKIKQIDLLDTVLNEVEQSMKYDNGRRNIYHLSLRELGTMLYHLVEYNNCKISTEIETGRKVIYRVWEVNEVLKAIKKLFPEEYSYYFHSIEKTKNIAVEDNKYTVSGYYYDNFIQSVRHLHTQVCVQ